MKKRVVALLLSLTLVAASLTGCTKTTDSGNGGETTSSTTKTESSASTESNGGSDELITIEIYDEAANYQGVQTGWFAKVVKDRFNIELNIIAPQVAGDAVYQTRTATGNLGDIVLLDPTHFTDCVAAGLIKDISGEIKNCSNLMEFDRQITAFNTALPDNNGAVYGIPCEMTNTSPTSFSDDVVYSSPMLRWDLYSGIGAPDIADLDGLLDTIKKIQDANPTNEDGDPAYGFSLWPDWDNNDGMIGIANVVQLTTWYGEKIKGSAILTADDKFIKLTDKNGTYYKMLKFLYKANQMGLVDPESGSQNWDNACAKMSSGRVYTFWYSWQVGFWNTQERLADGKGMIFIPVQDQNYYTTSDTYYGSGRVFGVGSGVDGEKYDRIMKFLDWYASPEGVTFQHNGIEGFNYEVGADGKFTLLNDNALMDNLPVPEEYGGAGYSDGNNAINQWIVSSISTNPNTGESYGNTHWSSWKAATATKTKNEWSARFGAAEPAEWMKAHNALLVRPSVSVSLPSEDADITVIRNQVGQEVKDASWKMIFAKNDAEFDSMWDTMVENLDSLGFEQLYKFDVDKYTIELEAMQAAK